MPTLDDLITDLNGATTFSTLDLRNGYHQLELHPSSRYITTFSTHVALYRYKRLMFGINSASEIFQNTVAELLRDLPGCRNISDDIIVYGKTVAEHNTNLTAVLDRLRTNNVRLNREKCKISRKTVTFYGHVLRSRFRRTWTACRSREDIIDHRSSSTSQRVRRSLAARHGAVCGAIYPQVRNDRQSAT